jgi:toxin ParE1/3/4
MMFRLSVEASNDLDQIYDQGAWSFGIQIADDYSLKLEKTFELIAQYPNIARERPEFRQAIRVHPFGRHIIIYTIELDHVLIVRVRHSREDWQSDYV